MSVASLDDAPPALDDAIDLPATSLEEYLAQEHEMGPFVPDGVDFGELSTTTTSTSNSDVSLDPYFTALIDEAEGEDEDPPPEDPVVTTTDPEPQPDGSILVGGTISDDGDLSNCTISVEGPTQATVTIDENGGFTVEIPPGANCSGEIVITVTDADGNTTTITIPCS